jgi:hypothetical protein
MRSITARRTYVRREVSLPYTSAFGAAGPTSTASAERIHTRLFSDIEYWKRLIQRIARARAG